MRLNFFAVLLFIGCLFVHQSAIASDETPTKVTNQNRSGDLPFSSSVGTAVEHVDVASGALNVMIPLIRIPGRGLNSELYLRWNSNYFVMAPRLNQQGAPYWIWNFETNSGWQTNRTYHSSSPLLVQCTDYPFEGYMTGYTNHIYTDPSGAKHPLAIESEQGNCKGPGVANGPDLTGEGMMAASQASSSTVLLADGGTEDLKDNNGNQQNGSMDTLGQIFYTVQTTLDGQGNVTQNKYTYTDSNGVAQIYTVNWQLINVTTSFGVTSGWSGGVTEITNATRNVVTSIVQPNGQQYVFKYNDPYGEITEIDLPTGGVVTYAWATLSDTRQTRRYVSSRTETVNGVQSTWQFSISVVSPFVSYSSTVTYPPVGNPPVQNQSVFVSSAGTITNAKVYAGSATGTPLREYQMLIQYDGNPIAGETCYNDILPPPWSEAQPVGQRVTRITTILENGQQSKKEFDYDSFTYTYYPRHCGDATDNNTAVQYTTSRGNVIAIREYDWGQGAPGSLIRNTIKTYLHNSNSTYLTYNIVSKVLQESIYDSIANTCLGVSQPCAQTQFEYDNYVAGVNPLLSTSSAPQHDYTNYSSAFIYRGNVTRVKRWRNTDGQLVTSIYTYDDLGNIRAVSDPLSHTTTYDYGDSWSGTGCLPPSNSYAYVTTTTNALSQQFKRTYFPCTGLLQARKDPNDIQLGRAGTTYLYDMLGRNTQKSSADGGQLTTSYNDAPPVTITSTTKITSTLNMVSLATEDGLGRVVGTQLTSDPEGTTYVDTTYDPLGRKSTISNPYRSTSDPTYGITIHVYDALSRITKLIPPDGTTNLNNVTTVYAGSCATVTDQASKSRESCSDGLGRLTQVFEDHPLNGGLNYETDYKYDVLGNLLRVDQKGGDPNSANWRTRTFGYNSLSLLLNSSNPESGTITYSYDNGENLLAKVSPAPNQPTGTQTISYCYDALNRRTGKKYAAQSCPLTSPDATYSYDQTSYNGLTITNGKGHRTGMTDASGITAWSYDAVGQPLAERRTINSVTKSIGYTYNLDASLATLTYPSGKTVTYSYNGAARPVSAIDVASNINYVTAATYTPPGGLSTYKNGVTGSFAGITVTNGYNNRLQPTVISAGTQTATFFSLGFGYGPANQNNGNPSAIANNLIGASGRNQTFTYDALNRISTAQSQATTGTACWGQSFGYDPWGNLQTITSTKCSSPILSAAADNKNHMIGFNYDAAGNLTKEGSGTPSWNYSWDAENRLNSISGSATDTFTYDGDGERVKKSNGALFWRQHGGPFLTKTGLTGTVIVERIYFGEKHVAAWHPSGSVNYFFQDALGGEHIVTDANGNMCNDIDTLPFGSEIVYMGSCDPSYKFAGMERDDENSANLDYAVNRYYDNRLGRWLSADWAAKATTVPYADFGDPRSLNLYGYVRNNPLSHADVAGHCLEDFCIAETAVVVALYTYTASPQGQQTIQNGLNALASTPGVIENLFRSDNSAEQPAPPPSSTNNQTPSRTAQDELPRDANGRPVPDAEAAGADHTQLGTRQSRSQPGTSYPQSREFDKNGKPVKDIDHTDHGRSDHTNPHQHPYDPGTGKRLPQEPVAPVKPAPLPPEEDKPII